jgi:hypothetical protein
LSDSDTSNEAASINLTNRSSRRTREKDGDTSHPNEAKLSSRPETANSICDEEGYQGTKDGSHLHHGGDIGQELCLLMFTLAGVRETELFLEGFQF